MIAALPSSEGQQSPPASGRWERLARRLTAIFAASQAGLLAGLALLLAVRKALFDADVDEVTVDFLSALASSPVETVVGPYGPALGTEVRLLPAYRGWYIANAARRLTRNPLRLEHPQTTEVRFWWLHRAASANRVKRSGQVDTVSRLIGAPNAPAPLLGWQSVLDDKTTPDCRWASGRNFRADRRPPLGWPGTVHPKCRCRAVPPFPGAPTM